MKPANSHSGEGRKRENPPNLLDGFTLNAYNASCRERTRELTSPGRVCVAQTRRAGTSQHSSPSAPRLTIRCGVRGIETEIGRRGQTVRGLVSTNPFPARGSRIPEALIEGGIRAASKGKQALTDGAPATRQHFTAEQNHGTEVGNNYERPSDKGSGWSVAPGQEGALLRDRTGQSDCGGAGEEHRQKGSRPRRSSRARSVLGCGAGALLATPPEPPLPDARTTPSPRSCRRGDAMTQDGERAGRDICGALSPETGTICTEPVGRVNAHRGPDLRYEAHEGRHSIWASWA